MRLDKKIIAALCCAVVGTSALAGCSMKSKKTISQEGNHQVAAKEEKQEGKDSSDKKEGPAAESSMGCYVEEEINAPEFEEGEYSSVFYLDSQGNPKFISTKYKDMMTDAKAAEIAAGSDKKESEEDTNKEVEEGTTKKAEEGAADKAEDGTEKGAEAGVTAKAEAVSGQQEEAEPVLPEYAYYTYTRKNEMWEKEELLGLDHLPEGQYIEEFIEWADGEYYLMCSKYTMPEGDDNTPGKSEYFLYDYNAASHELKDVSPDEWVDLSSVSEEQSSWARPENFEVSSEGELLYLTYVTDEIHIYNPKTKEHNTIDCGQGGNRFAVSGRKIYFSTWENIKIIDMDTQKEEEPIPLTVQGNINLMVTKAEKLYTASENGIKAWNPDTSEWDYILKGKDSVLGARENSYVNKAFTVDGDHDEFYFYLQGMEQKVVHTYYDPTASNVKEYSLKIYSLTENDTIKDLVVKYQQTHKNIDVDYVVGLEQGEEGLVDDELKRVNSELLAGDGADIYILHGLPMQQFIEKNVLADLSDVLKPLIEQDELIGPMKDYYTEPSGAIYRYPVRMIVPVSIYNELVTQENPTLDELIQMTDSNDKVKTALGNTIDNFMMADLKEYGSSWISEDRRIDIEQWKSYVNDVIRMKDYCFTYKFDNEIDTSEMDASSMVPSRTYDDLITNQYYGIYGDDTGIVNGTCLRNDDCISSTIDMVKLQALTDQYNCHYEVTNGCFEALATLGMNQNGKNKEQAEAFLQAIYSPEYQYSRSSYTLPVIKSSLKKTVMMDTEDRQNHSYSFGFGENQSIDMNGEDIRDDFLMDLYDKLCNVQRPFMEDTKLLILMANQTQKVLDGELQLDEAAADLSNKLSLYLAE